MRKLIAALVVAIALVPAALVSPAHAAGPPVLIYVENTSTEVTDAQLAAALPAFQAAVSEDFAPVWGVDAQLVLGGTPPDGAEVMYVVDHTDVPGALGYHWVDNGAPYGVVAAKDSDQFEGALAWQYTFTHELFEMLADPFGIRRLHSRKTHCAPARTWLAEVADPVESDRYGYYRVGGDGMLVGISDFITKRWYGGKGPYDFQHHLKYAGQILDGGYASYWDGYEYVQLGPTLGC